MVNLVIVSCSQEDESPPDVPSAETPSPAADDPSPAADVASPAYDDPSQATADPSPVIEDCRLYHHCIVKLIAMLSF